MARKVKGRGTSTRKGNTGTRNAKSNTTNTKRVPDTDSGDYTASDKGMRNCQKTSDNDPMWYAQNPQILKDSASFSFNYPLGSKLNFGVEEAAKNMNSTSLPGIMAIYTSPAFGSSTHSNSPINTAARNIYSFVRHANSGHSNYDAPDLMLYLTAMDNLYAFVSFLKRAYGLMSPAYYTNRYYPKAIIQSMKLDYDDLNARLNDFRSYINRLAIRVGSMCIPASMSYMARHMWMYEHVWTDDMSDKAQTYLYTPHGFFRYSRDIDSAGMLEYKALFSGDESLLKLRDLYAYGESLLEPILSSEDMNIMSGDILKAFGPENLYKINMIDENYLVLPEYSEEVLNQIQNSSLIGHFKGTPTLHQDPTKGFLIFDPEFDALYTPDSELKPNQYPGMNVMVTDRLVSFTHGDIKPEDTMVATRLTNIMSYDATTNSYSYKCNTMGSEIAHHATIYNYEVDDLGGWSLKFTPALYTSLVFILDNSSALSGTESDIQAAKQIATDLGVTLATIGKISTFDRHPAFGLSGYIRISTNYNNTPMVFRANSVYNAIMADASYFTILNEQDLLNMAETALLSEFNVLQYGKYGN